MKMLCVLVCVCGMYCEFELQIGRDPHVSPHFKYNAAGFGKVGEREDEIRINNPTPTRSSVRHGCQSPRELDAPHSIQRGTNKSK